MNKENTRGTVLSVEHVRTLLQRIGFVFQTVEEDVHLLVEIHAWAVLGYNTFSEMWHMENGYKAPAYIDALVVRAMREINPELNQMQIVNRTGIPRSSVQSIIRQLDHGVPVDKIIRSAGLFEERITHHGRIPRARLRPRRLGKQSDELIDVSFKTYRWADDKISELARTSNVPKSEIYRQIVEEYLARLDTVDLPLISPMNKKKL